MVTSLSIAYHLVQIFISFGSSLLTHKTPQERLTKLWVSSTGINNVPHDNDFPENPFNSFLTRTRSLLHEAGLHLIFKILHTAVSHCVYS